MSIYSFLKQELVNHGLWPNEADAVLSKLQATMPEMEQRWHDNKEGYPTPLIATLWATAKRRAIEHLKAETPQHFALMLLAQPD